MYCTLHTEDTEYGILSVEGILLYQKRDWFGWLSTSSKTHKATGLYKNIWRNCGTKIVFCLYLKNCDMQKKSVRDGDKKNEIFFRFHLFIFFCKPHRFWGNPWQTKNNNKNLFVNQHQKIESKKQIKKQKKKWNRIMKSCKTPIGALSFHIRLFLFFKDSRYLTN